MSLYMTDERAEEPAHRHPFWGQDGAESLVPHWLAVRMAWEAREAVYEAGGRRRRPWPGDDDIEAVALSALVQRILAAPASDAGAIGVYWGVVERDLLQVRDREEFIGRPRVEQIAVMAVRGLVLGMARG